MKKLLLLAVALVMSVCSWAQVNLASGVYEIENVSDEGGAGIGRGYLVDYTSYAAGPSIGDCPWTNHRNNHPTERNNGTTTCSYWYLYNDEGTYYIFSLSTLGGNTAPKFLQLGTPSNNNSVKLARWSSDKVALEVVDNPNATNSVGIRNVGVTANNGYLSMACGTKSTDGSIKVDALTDGGAKLALKSVALTELSAEQKAVMTAGIAICEKAPSYPTFDAEKQYTFHATASQRGYLAYNPAETSKVGLADVTLSAQYAGMHPTSTTEGVGINWKVETTAPGKVILYNTTSEKYLGKSGAVAVWVEKANAQVLEVSEKSEGVYNFKVDNVYLVAACGYAEDQGAVRFNSYEQAADLTVAEVEGTEPGPKPENTTLSVSLFNGSDEIALSTEAATNVATATGIKFTYENVSSDYFGYSCYINQEGAEDPLYIGGGEIGEGTDTDTFDAAINFVKGEQYQVVVSFILNGPSFTFNITGTYEEEEGPTGETVATYNIVSARPNKFFAYNNQLCTASNSNYAGNETTENSEWLKIPTKEETGFFFYNVSTKQFMGQSTDNVKIPMTADAPIIYYVWANGQSEEYGFSIGTETSKASGYILNASSWGPTSDFGARLAPSKSCNYDAGNELKFVEVGTVSVEDFETIKKAAWDAYYAPIVLPFTLSDEENTYCYNIKNPNTRGTVYVKVQEDNRIRFTADEEEADKFAFYQGAEEGDGTAYIYNVTTKKYVTYTADASASVDWGTKQLNAVYVVEVATKEEAQPWAFVPQSEGVYDILPTATSNNGWNFCGGINEDFVVLNLYDKSDNDSKWEFVETENSEGPADEPTLSFNDNKDKTFTITPSSATDKWYAAIVPASIFDEVSEEEKEYVAGGYLSQYTVELLTSLDEAYVGTKTFDAAELYAEQNEEAELEAGEYFVVAGYVQGVALGEITMVQPKTIQWFAYTVAGEEVPTDEPTLSFTDNEDNTFTVTPSSATEKWYAAIVPATIFDEVSEEEKEYVAGGYLSQYTAECLTSLDEAYVGTKTLDAAELYAEQNEEAELEAGDYYVVAGYVQGVALGEISMVSPKTVQWFAYTQHEEEGEGEGKEPNTTTKFFTGAELRAEVAAVGIAKVGLVNVTATSNKYVNGKAYNGTFASADNTLAGVRAPQADEILEVVAVEGGYTLRQADAAEGEGYLKCAAGGNFTTSTAAEANVWKIASEGEDGFDVKGTITNYDDLYTDIDKSINPNMVRFVSEGQYLNGQNRDSQGGLRGGTGAWSFVYVYNANYIDSTTGVGTVLAPIATESIFNLQGQRIVKLQKGINIVGGKKVIK